MTGAPTEKDQLSAAPVPEFLSAGSSFARYQIVRCIGVGGMGSVFEATHTLLRKRVALKAMHSSLGRSEASRVRFLREAETVARIRHPNVVDISDVGIERGIPFLVMEFLEGEDLASLLSREGRLSVQRAVDIVLPVVAGLAAVHRLGIVHRDIKPENVFLALDALGDVVPKLVDFGVSKDLEASGPLGGVPRHTIAGTPYYMAPEQARGSAVLDARADQYAVGVLLYQCLAGVRPFQSESLLELIHLVDSGDYLPLSSHRDDLPEALRALIARAMARSPEARFPSSEEFGRGLALFASELVRRASERDFALERRSSLPLSQPDDAPRSFAPALAAQTRLSAPTLPITEPAPLAPVATRAFPRRAVSGVQTRRDSEAQPVAAPAQTTRARTAFVAAALVTLLCLLALLALLTRRQDAPTRVRTEPPPTPQQVAPTARPQAAPAPQPGEAAQQGASPQPRKPAAKPRREDAPNSSPARPDIQLSR